MSIRDLLPLPLSAGTLARYRIASRRQRRAGLMGGHQMRRKGQSLDFRDFEVYAPGDDIRHVDWRASARSGRRHDLLVRHYAAEEQLSLVLSIDTRMTMRLPEAMPKLQMAAWLIEAVAAVALGAQDRVFIHRLFGKASDSLVSLRGSGSRGLVRKVLRRFNTVDTVETLNLKPLRACLAPTTVWMIATDLYFDDPDQVLALAREITRARNSYCWVILVDLDSWPMERNLLGEGARRIEGPGADTRENRFEITDENLDSVAAAIRAHKNAFFARAKSCDRSPWHWGETADPAGFFREHFLGDPVIGRLFMKDA